MTSRPDVTVTVVSWNTRELLRACLVSLRGASGLEVHVVDNASEDGSGDMVATEFPDVLLLSNTTNLGFARANNQSWKVGRGRYWLLLNSDAEIRPGAIDALVRFADLHPRAALVTARLVSPDGSPQHCAQPLPSITRGLAEALRLHKLLPARWREDIWLGPYWPYNRAGRVGWAWGTALLARREAVEEAGPLSEDFFMYGEDLEWSLRMRQHGWEVWFCPEAEVLHHGSASARLAWADPERERRILKMVYRAVEMHRGRPYTWCLKASACLALAIESTLARLSGRPNRGAQIALRENWSLLFGRDGHHPDV